MMDEKEKLLQKARSRALYLLGDMPRTEKQLREKLAKNKYPQEIIDQVLMEMQEYRYIDDLQYARDYILSRSDKKSRRVILMELQQKGISKEILEEACDCFSGEKERQLIRRLVEKRGVDPSAATREELQKLYQYLMRKGFLYEEIKEILGELQEDFT